MIWYALIAVFVADEITGLFPNTYAAPAVAAVAAVAMAVNNLFGFVGVANFAGFVQRNIDTLDNCLVLQRLLH